MHVTLLLAGFLAKAQKGTCGAIIFMVLLKIAMDLSLHLREHLKFRGAAPQGRADSGKETGPVPR